MCERVKFMENLRRKAITHDKPSQQESLTSNLGKSKF